MYIAVPALYLYFGSNIYRRKPVDIYTFSSVRYTVAERDAADTKLPVTKCFDIQLKMRIGYLSRYI